jgi:microcystin-dependent protein
MATKIHTFGGNIGIGTTDPGSYKLNVNGSTKVNSLVIGGITNAHVPIGFIAMWSGTIASIPTGWTLCNGVAVTRTDGGGSITPPDLRTKFVYGAYGDNPAPAVPGQTGGQVNKTLAAANLPSHTHAGTTGTANAPHNHTDVTSAAANAPHSHGVSDPGHSHTVYGISRQRRQNGVSFQELSNSNRYWYMNGALGGISIQAANAPHSHTFTTNAANAPHSHTFTTQATGQGQAFSILPPYRVLAYIMKH